MPQGDIRLKQQNLSGHRWVTVFDFASGFYACEVEEDDQPYICFYVEGRGYFAYKRMPFGLTGAPSAFGEMTAGALGDLIGTLMELFVDDGGLAGDNFETMLADTRKLLQRISETGLSLSVSKSKFFMTEATFAGGRVGPEGIKPDLTKLTALVDWKAPMDLQNLGSFLGLAGYFRSLHLRFPHSTSNQLTCFDHVTPSHLNGFPCFPLPVEIPCPRCPLFVLLVSR
jgi:hypothetical protein